MLRITGGKVYDPANNINGTVKDICIADGRIVSAVDGGRSIDATGMVVFPGGVDVHTHVAGGALNFARGLVPETQRAARKFLHTAERRSGLGGMTPTTFATGYLYAGMGWTTVNEAAVPILSARHTHEELHDIPIVDKTSLCAQQRWGRSAAAPRPRGARGRGAEKEGRGGERPRGGRGKGGGANTP